MSRSLREVIEEARAGGEYACVRCRYDLSVVPLDDELAVTCPECGYEMAFDVRVRLRPRDPEYDRPARRRLRRVEILLLWVVLGVVVTAFGMGIIVMAIVGR